MSNVDRSASATTRLLRIKTLVSFYNLNPNTNEGGNKILSAGVYTERKGGAIELNATPITNFKIVSEEATDPASAYSAYTTVINLKWDPVPGSNYTLTTDEKADLIVYTGEKTASVYTNTVGQIIFTLVSETRGGVFRATARRL